MKVEWCGERTRPLPAEALHVLKGREGFPLCLARTRRPGPFFAAGLKDPMMRERPGRRRLRGRLCFPAEVGKNAGVFPRAGTWARAFRGE